MTLNELENDLRRFYATFGWDSSSIGPLMLTEIGLLTPAQQAFVRDFSHSSLEMVVAFFNEEKRIDKIFVTEGRQLGQLGIALVQGFFKKCEWGEVYCDLGIIKDTFGATLEKNYSLSSGPFIKVARAYWTFKFGTRDIIDQNAGSVIAEFLKGIEFELAALFFPTGPGISPEDRELAQRRLLGSLAPALNADEFVSSSPILKIGRTEWHICRAQKEYRAACVIAYFVLGIWQYDLWLMIFRKLSQGENSKGFGGLVRIAGRAIWQLVGLVAYILSGLFISHWLWTLFKGTNHGWNSRGDDTNAPLRDRDGNAACPNCGLLNPPQAEQCDCGYNLTMAKEPPPSSTSRGPISGKKAERKETWRFLRRKVKSLDYCDKISSLYAYSGNESEGAGWKKILDREWSAFGVDSDTQKQAYQFEMAALHAWLSFFLGKIFIFKEGGDERHIEIFREMFLKKIEMNLGATSATGRWLFVQRFAAYESSVPTATEYEWSEALECCEKVLVRNFEKVSGFQLKGTVLHQNLQVDFALFYSLFERRIVKRVRLAVKEWIEEWRKGR